jgi:hypothetical protein
MVKGLTSIRTMSFSLFLMGSVLALPLVFEEEGNKMVHFSQIQNHCLNMKEAFIAQNEF